MSKRKYSDYTLQLKAKVLRRHLDGEKVTFLAREYNVPQNTISTWKKNANKIFEEVTKSVEPDRKRMRFSEYPDIEKALLYWLKDMRSMDHPPPIDLTLLMHKAESLAKRFDHNNWICSRGFVQRFCRRYGVLSKKICGEALDCPDTQTFEEEVLQPLLSKYQPEDIFNADETSFFFKMLPQQTYAFKGQPCSGNKTSKDRLTLMLCCNMTGSEKLRPLIIGKAKKPAILKKFNMGVQDLPVDYYNNAKGWMTGIVFDNWLSKWNHALARKNRQILLFIDNAPSHVVQNYSHITVQFLPPNTTSKIQPLDQGVIRAVKLHYRRYLAEMYLAGIESNADARQLIKDKFHFKTACDLIKKAWQKITPNLIHNCFSKAGFCTNVPGPADDDESDMRPQRNLWESIQTALNITIDFEEYATADDNVETSTHLTDEEIVNEVKGGDPETEVDEDDDDDNGTTEEDTTVNTTQQFLTSTAHLRAYLQRNKMDTKLLDDLEQQIVQTNIKKQTVQPTIRTFLYEI